MSEQINYKEIKKIINLMEEKDLSHFEIEIEGFKINISRNISSSRGENTVSAQPVRNFQEDETALNQESQPENNDNLHYISSPMVGTYYSAPDPSSSSFVEVGDEVKKNQVLCIIEAMKLMNEIESDIDGIIKEIFVETGKPIEYGQKIFSIQLQP